MSFKPITGIIPWAALIFVAGIFVHALVSNTGEINQWPGRLGRFIVALFAGALIFGLVYFVGGLLVSNLGYTYNDKPLLRLAHLVCLIGIYPAAMTAGSIFRTRHTALILGIAMTFGVHLLDKSTYLGRMVFSDPALPLNGDFALTNMALMLVGAILGGEAGLRVTLPGLYRKAAQDARDVESPEMPSLTSGGG